MTSADRRSRPGLPLAAHLGLLVAALAVALAVTERDRPFTVDEGSYAIQAEAVAEGSWEIGWPFRGVDADARHFPYHGGRVTDDAEYAYVSHPAWPAALSVARSVGSEAVGLRLLPMLSLVAGAAIAWALARRLAGEAAAPWALWIVASSPLLANGLIVWAHAPAAALAGLGALAAVQLGDRARGPWPWVALLAAVAVGVLLRSELLLAAGALAATLAGVGLRTRRRDLVVAAAAVTVFAGAAALLERGWIRSITGSGGSDLSSRASDDGAFLSGRLDGAATVLIEGATGSSGAAICSVVALVLVVGAAIARRRAEAWTGPRPAVLLVLAAGLVVARAVVAPEDTVSGLLVAWPVVGLLALLRGGDDPRRVLLLVGSGLFALAVLATQYDDGGGLQWGGRFLAPILVPVGATTAVVVVDRLDRLERRAVAALLGATAALTLVVPDQLRRANADGTKAIDATGSDVVLVEGEQLARLDWASWPERCWIAVGDDLASAVAVLRDAGIGRVATVGVRYEDLRELGVAADASRQGSLVGTADIGLRAPNMCSSSSASR